jgi:hypothetical protein
VGFSLEPTKKYEVMDETNALLPGYDTLLESSAAKVAHCSEQTAAAYAAAANEEAPKGEQ